MNQYQKQTQKCTKCTIILIKLGLQFKIFNWNEKMKNYKFQSTFGFYTDTA